MGYPNVFSTAPSAETYGISRSYTEFYITSNGSSSPTLATGNVATGAGQNPVGSPLITAMSRSAQGVWLITFGIAMPDVLYASADMDDTANDGAYATIGSWANLGSAQPPAGAYPTMTLNIRSGINPSGTATLTAGTVTVAQGVPTGSTIQVTRNTPGGTLGNLSAPSASRTSSQFVINSSSGTETSTVDWTIVQPQLVDPVAGRKVRVCIVIKKSVQGVTK